MHTLRQTIGRVVQVGKMTKPQGDALLRHKRYHSEGCVYCMFMLMVEKQFTFEEAHKRATAAVGR